MTSGRNIPQHTNANRKRSAANNEAPAPRRHHPDAVDQLLETMKFQQEQINRATDIWVRLNGGEDNLVGGHAIFLGLIKSTMYSERLAVKLVESQEEEEEEDDDDDDVVDVDDDGNDDDEDYDYDIAENDHHLEARFIELETSLTEKQASDFKSLEQDMEDFVYYEANEAAKVQLSTSEFHEAVSEAVAQELNITSREELKEMTQFVRLQMKLSKNAPETSQDILREHEVEIGL